MANSNDLAAESNWDSVVNSWNFSASSVYSINIDSLNFSQSAFSRLYLSYFIGLTRLFLGSILIENRISSWSDPVYASLSIYQLSISDSIADVANIRSIIDIFPALDLWNVGRSSIFFSSKLNLSNQGINSLHLIGFNILEFHQL